MGYGQERLHALADRALALAGVEGVEVGLSASSEALTRFAESVIHQNVARADGEARVRVVLPGGHVGVAATNVLEQDAIFDAAERARDAARAAPPDHEFPGLAPPSSYDHSAVYDEETANCSPSRRA